MTRCRSVYGW